jgi:hypothetical protein
MNRLKEQFQKLWATLTGQETLPTYRKALDLTWQILKETLVLLWLVLCLVVVAGEWVWNGAIAVVNQGKTVLDKAKDTSSDQMVTDTGKALLTASSDSVAFAIDRAKEQLGLPVQPRVKPAPKPPSADPKSAANPSEAKPSEPTPSEPASSEPAVSSAAASAASPAPSTLATTDESEPDA